MELDDLLKQIKQKPEQTSKEASPTKPTSTKNQAVTDDATKITPQMQKRITDFLKSDHQEVEAPAKGKAIFDKKSFGFIPLEPVLDKKKIDALTEKIRRRGGITFRVDFFDWKKPSFVELFIVVSKEMPYQNFLNSVPESIHDKLDSFVFVDWKWIIDCLQQNELLSNKSYQVDWKKVAEAEEQARREQARKEEARRRERDLVVEQAPEPEPEPNLETVEITKLKKEEEPKKPSSDEEKLQDEELELLEKDEVPLAKKRLRVKENPLLMNTYRNLYDYRFGIEDETEEMEVESPAADLEHQETQKISDDEEESHNESSRPFSKQMTSEKEESKGLSDLEMELEENPPPKKEKFNILQAMMKGQRSPSRNNLAAERSPRRDAIEHNPGRKELTLDPAPHSNLNKHLTDEFERLLQAYVNDKDKGRMHAYRKALASLRGLPFKVEDADQVKGVSGIGDKIRKKIQEILTTGKLKKADEMTQGEKQQVLTALTKVWGIGVQTATSLYEERGVKSVEELKKYAFLLNDNQKIGLKYYEEFEQRIPRDDITEMQKIIEDKVTALTGGKKGVYRVTCCGSYRRGKATCGDIDVLMTKNDGTSFEGFLAKLIRGLEGVLLTDHLTKAKMSPQGSETYMGVACYKGIHRRIDMKIYPRNEYGYAVLYFTGSDYFNRKVRLIALEKGWSLSDHGISRVVKKNNKTEMIPENLPCETEEQVFDLLGIKFCPPEERDI